MYERQHGAENFFAVGLHVWRDVVEQCPADEESNLMVGNRGLPTIDEQDDTFANTTVDIAADLVAGKNLYWLADSWIGSPSVEQPIYLALRSLTIRLHHGTIAGNAGMTMSRRTLSTRREGWC